MKDIAADLTIYLPYSRLCWNRLDKFAWICEISFCDCV